MECSILYETINEINFCIFFFISSSIEKKLSRKQMSLLKSGTIFNDIFTTEDISQFHPVTIVCLLLWVYIGIENHQPVSVLPNFYIFV